MSASLNALYGYKSIAVSDDLSVAVGSEKILNFFRLTCKTAYTSGTFVLNKSVLEYDDKHYYPDVGVPDHRLTSEIKSQFFSKCDAGATFHIDGTIGSPTGSLSQVLVHSLPRSLCWSPKGCSATGGCILAFLRTDHRLTLYAEKRISNWVQVADVSSLLHKYVKSKRYKITPDAGESSSNIVKMAINRFAMFSVEDMAWSGIYKEPDGTQGAAYIVLATYSRHGLIIFWKCSLPFLSEGNISICGVVESGIDWPSSIKWEQYSTTFENSLLAIGNTEGQVKIWNLKIDHTEVSDSQVTLVAELELWEKDLIPVSCFYWATVNGNQEGLQRQTCHRLIVGKGQHILVFDLYMDENSSLKVKRQGHTHALHSTPITGLSAHGDTITVISETHMKQKILIKQESGSFLLVPTVVEAPRIRNNYSHGTSMSPNGAISAELSTHIQRTHKRHTIDSLVLNWELDPAIINGHLLNPSTADIADRLDFLEFFRQSILNHEEIKLPALRDLDKIDKDKYKYFRQLHLFYYKLKLTCASKQPHRLGEEEHYQQTIKKLDVEVEKITKSLLADHLVGSLRFWQVSPQVIQTEDALSIHLALNWLIGCNTLNEIQDKIIVKKVYEKLRKENAQSSAAEVCCLCSSNIPFTNIFDGKCKNKHKWRRCSQSLRLCQRSPTNYCEVCGAIALKPGEGSWYKMVLRSTCLNCGGRMVPW
ncbi:general transcription factor 3C polypeptide 4-like isoform X2 [Anneissia japonica]|uniref:general transcription factor 3C polypeptide 4-like isoform X1 n=1 Tax=Anneissia japonica TaxID=1529436 RepID=UPI0014254D44|nr:general transcription factor 3C polypeptide 4-like isoform X1 [Anneissia japonica]XP_033104167.1 general transcription factor 3C polypeptide 4-like isoform X2 [Anneissia japonica]